MSVLIKGMEMPEDCRECRHWCGGCDPMDYCSCGERAERRADDKE